MNAYFNYLNDPNCTLEENRQKYFEMRQKYANDTLALQRVDVFDSESPYWPKYEEYRAALLSKNTERITEIEAWFRENYPNLSI